MDQTTKDQMINRVKELARTHDKRAIAKELGITYGWVMYYCEKLGIKTAKPSNQLEEEFKSEAIKFFLEHGIHLTMKHFSLCRSTVYRIMREYRDGLKNNNSDETANELQSLRIECLNKARSTEWSNEAEDFASWATVKFLEEGSRPVKFLWIDYLRERFGSNRSKIGREKININHSLAQIMTHDSPINETHTEIQVGIEEQKIIEIIDACSFKDEKLRAIAILVIIFGMKYSELGIVYDVNPTRISQLMADVFDKIRKRLK